MTFYLLARLSFLGGLKASLLQYVMKRDIANVELEKSEGKGVKLPNGEVMDRYSLREGVLLYGASIEGDDYSFMPLTFVPGDAVLTALNRMYVKDTIGVATAEFPPNSESSQAFRFNSMIRLREYRFDARAMFYDARNRIRPACSDVGISNFKTSYELTLPEGNDIRILASPLAVSGLGKTSKAQDLPVDTILGNILNKATEYTKLKIDAFFFCQPGKTLRIEQSYRIDMAVLYTFYAALLSKGYNPNRIRTEAFIGEKSVPILGRILTNRQVPTTIGDLPERVLAGIRDGNDLEQLALICAGTALGQKACVSGNFFKQLWTRDVKSILDYYLATAFASDDKGYYYPNVDAVIQKAGKFSPYVANWYYSQDFFPEMGRDDLAYNWNYNRYLDVNTIVYWLLTQLTTRNYLIDTPTYQRSKHLEVIKRHRFTDQVIASIKNIAIYDAASEVMVTIALSQDNALFINTHLLSLAPRAGQTREAVQKLLEDLVNTTKGKLSVNRGLKDLRGEYRKEVQIVVLAPSNQTIKDIPSNWFSLQLISAFLRYLIRNFEFSFVSFERG